MSRYVVANWKSNKTLAECSQWVSSFLARHRPHPDLKVIVAPSFPFLFPLKQMFSERKSDVLLACQDISPFPVGSYTGAVAGALLEGVVDFTLVGHSERRRWFHETNQEVANKVYEALAAGITPIVCVDQPYARSQLAALSDHEQQKSIIGYGPVEAVGVEISPSLERVGEAVAGLKVMAPDTPILYGGSVNAQNAGELMSIPELSGLMVATASHDADEFADICRLVAESDY